MTEARILILGENGSQILDSLSDAGMRGEYAASPDEALSRLAAEKHQILICDIELILANNGALMDDFHRVRSGLCVLAVATDPPADQVIWAVRRGVFDFLLRPVCQETLLRSVKRGLDNQKLFVEVTNLSHEVRERTLELEEQSQRLLRDREEMQVLNDIARAMTSTLNLEEILRIILDGIHRVLDFDRVVLALINKDKMIEEAKLSTGSDDEEFRKQCWNLDDPANPWMGDILEGRKTVVANPGADPAYQGTPAARLYPTPFVKVPMIVKGHVIGTITSDNIRTSRPITPDDVRRAEMLCGHAGIAIENARLYYDILQSREEVLQTQKQLVEAERLAALGAMAASINHEINNPLCAIVLDTQLLLMSLTPEQEKIKKRIESIESSVRRIRAVTEKIAAVKRTIVTDYQPKTKMLDLDLSTK